MRRREVIAGLSATAAWPRAAGAQQKTSPLIGILRMPPAALDLFIRPFRAFMTGLGWEEGRTVAYRISYADGDAARMPELAKALVTSGADVLVAAGTSSIRVLQNATATIPIVGLGEDFVGAGFAKSMARPGGNVTGVSILATELDAKRLEVLRAALPTRDRSGSYQIRATHFPPSGGTLSRKPRRPWVFGSRYSRHVRKRNCTAHFIF